jgi:hypothetical protein
MSEASEIAQPCRLGLLRLAEIRSMGRTFLDRSPSLSRWIKRREANASKAISAELGKASTLLNGVRPESAELAAI